MLLISLQTTLMKKRILEKVKIFKSFFIFGRQALLSLSQSLIFHLQVTYAQFESQWPQVLTTTLQ